MHTNGKKNGIRKLTPEQAKRLFDRQVRRSLRMSGQEFIRRWERGEYKDLDDPELIRLSMLMPLGR